MAQPEYSPDVSPSGKPSFGYGEVMIRVWFTGPENDKYKSVETAVSAPEGMPLQYWRAASEHLAKAVEKKQAKENTGI